MVSRVGVNVAETRHAMPGCQRRKLARCMAGVGIGELVSDAADLQQDAAHIGAAWRQGVEARGSGPRAVT